MLHLEQKSIRKRLWIALPLFLAGFGILMFSIYNKNGFDIIWRYFAWANQLLAAVTLWAVSVYLFQEHKTYIITLIPAVFMTMVCITYIFISPEVFGLNYILSYGIGGIISLALLTSFLFYTKKNRSIVEISQ